MEKGIELSCIGALNKMVQEGYAARVAHSRACLLQIDQLQIKDKVEGFNTQAMCAVVERYWRPFVYLMEKSFTMIGICPYRIITHSLDVGNERVSFRVPVALELGTYTVRTLLSKRMERVFEVKDQFSNKASRIHVLVSLSRAGPSTYDPMVVDSDCGTILQEWLAFTRLEESTNRLRVEMQRPSVWLQYAGSIAARSVIQTTQGLNTHLEETAANHGYAVADKRTVKRIEVEKETIHGVVKEITHGALLIPDDLVLSSTQPSVPPALLDITEQRAEFKRTVEHAFKMPFWELKAQGTSMSGRSSASVDEDRSNIGSSLQTIVADLKFGIQTAWEEIYDVTPQMVVIPRRPLADLQTLDFVRERQAIGEEDAKRHMAGIVGFEYSKRTSPSPKRMRQDDVDLE